MEVEGDFLVRGGIHTVVKTIYDEELDSVTAQSI